MTKSIGRNARGSPSFRANIKSLSEKTVWAKHKGVTRIHRLYMDPSKYNYFCYKQWVLNFNVLLKAWPSRKRVFLQADWTVPNIVSGQCNRLSQNEASYMIMINSIYIAPLIHMAQKRRLDALLKPLAVTYTFIVIKSSVNLTAWVAIMQESNAISTCFAASFSHKVGPLFCTVIQQLHIFMAVGVGS